MNRYYIIHVLHCQVFYSCFFKLFLGAGQTSRDGARGSIPSKGGRFDGTGCFVPLSSLSRVSLAGLPVHEGHEDKEEGRDTKD
jgi:hypothetical protein